MTKRNIVLSLIALFFCAVQMNAQKIESDQIWKRHKKWMTLGYEIQSTKSAGVPTKSESAFYLSSGNTFFLHEEPIAGLMKFGIDWRHIDVTYANYGKLVLEGMEDIEDMTDMEMPDLNIMKLELGMGVGPSFTINPVDYLKTGVYFHVTPSYSILFNEGGLFGNYATFFNAGIHVAYKAISLGFEYRWCGDTNYKSVLGEGFSDEEEMSENPAGPAATLISTASSRLYVAFRFGGRKYKK